MAHRDKTLTRIQNNSQNLKHFWILESVFGFWEVFLDSGKCFWILGSVLVSEKCFWIRPERVLDSGKCFVPTSHRIKEPWSLSVP